MATTKKMEGIHYLLRKDWLVSQLYPSMITYNEVIDIHNNNSNEEESRGNVDMDSDSQKEKTDEASRRRF